MKTLMKTNFRWAKQVKEVLGEDKHSVRVMGFQIVFCKKKKFEGLTCRLIKNYHT